MDDYDDSMCCVNWRGLKCGRNICLTCCSCGIGTKHKIRYDIRIESEVWNVLNSVLCRCKIFKFYPNSLNEEKVKGKTLQFYLPINTKWALILKKKCLGILYKGLC